MTSVKRMCSTIPLRVSGLAWRICRKRPGVDWLIAFELYPRDPALLPCHVCILRETICWFSVSPIVSYRQSQNGHSTGKTVCLFAIYSAAYTVSNLSSAYSRVRLTRVCLIQWGPAISQKSAGKLMRSLPWAFALLALESKDNSTALVARASGTIHCGLIPPAGSKETLTRSARTMREVTGRTGENPSTTGFWAPGQNKCVQ